MLTDSVGQEFEHSTAGRACLCSLIVEYFTRKHQRLRVTQWLRSGINRQDLHSHVIDAGGQLGPQLGCWVEHLYMASSRGLSVGHWAFSQRGGWVSIANVPKK